MTPMGGAIDQLMSQTRRCCSAGDVAVHSCPAGASPTGFLFRGVLSSFDEARPIRDRMVGKYRRVATKDVQPSGAQAPGGS